MFRGTKSNNAASPAYIIFITFLLVGIKTRSCL
jgi:hypothetical protein